MLPTFVTSVKCYICFVRFKRGQLVTWFSFITCGRRRKDTIRSLPEQDWKRNDMHCIRESRECFVNLVIGFYVFNA